MGQRGGAYWHSFVAAHHSQTFLWTPVALATGICIHFSLPWLQQRLTVLGALLALAVVLACLKNLPGRIFLVATISLVAVGMLLSHFRETYAAAPKLERDLTATLEALVLDVSAKHLLVKPLAADRPLPALQRIRLKIASQPIELGPGARIRLKARLSVPQTSVSPKGYDFSRIAWFRGIGATGRILGPIQLIRYERTSSITGWFDALRDHAAKRFQSQIKGEAGAVAAALIVGERNSLSDETTQAMRISGLQHLLSVSGFHLAMLAGALFMGTRYFLALWPWFALHAPTKSIAAIVAVTGSLAYTLLTGSAYPTLRSLVAITIVMFGVMLGRTAISLRLLAAVALLLLALRPEALLDVSFQLSVTGVAALIAFFESKKVRDWLSPTENRGWPMRVIRMTGSTLLATLVAELALAPVAIAHFNQLGLYGLLANMIGVPVTEFILMPVGFLSFVLQPTGLDRYVNPFFEFSLNLFIGFAKWIAGLPHSQIRIPEIGGTSFVLIMAGIYVLILFQKHWKLVSLLFFVSGIIVAILVPVPDVRIAPEGKTIGVRAENGAMTFPNLRAGEFARNSWLEDEAAPADAATLWADAQEANCLNNLCSARLARTGRRLALLGKEAMPKQCPDADILIDLRRQRVLYCAAALYIDRRWLWDHGATELFVGPNQISIHTYTAVVGDHAWR
jgi:competence protein ComEC